MSTEREILDAALARHIGHACTEQHPRGICAFCEQPWPCDAWRAREALNAAPVFPAQVRITVTGDCAVVTVAGDGPLPPGRYLGAVVKITDRRKGAA